MQNTVYQNKIKVKQFSMFLNIATKGLPFGVFGNILVCANFISLNSFKYFCN